MAAAIRVLYVDDEPGLLSIGKLFLEKQGAFVVDTLTSAVAAMEHLKTERYDAIVSDYQMPGMDGITFLKLLKVSGNTTPFIIFTGKGREEVVIEALNEGADYYFQKGGEPKAQFTELAHKIKKGVEGRRTKRAFADSEEKYRRIVDTADEGIGLLDDQFRITYTNRRMAEMFGYTFEEMIGKEISSFMPESELADYSDRTKRQQEGVRDRFERQFVRKNGSILLTLVSITPITDTNGNFPGSVTIYSDITERKQAEEALKKSETFLNSIIENIPNTIFVKEAQVLRFVRFNKAGEDLLGYSRDDLYGKNDYDFFPKDEADFFTAKDREVLKNNQLLDIPDERIQTRDKGPRILHTKQLPILSNEGNPEFLIGISEDITERKRTEEALRIIQEKYTKAFLSAPDAITISELDSGRFTEVNDAATSIFGYTRDELIGKNAVELNIW